MAVSNKTLFYFAVWDSMMEGHAMMKTVPKTRSTTTPKPNSYNDNLSFGSDDLGNQGSASAKIDNVYRVPPPKGFVYISPTSNDKQFSMNSGTPEYRRPLNQLPFENILPSTAVPVKKYFDYVGQEVPLTGPMVVKVYPDGRPVQDGQVNLPQDEDLRQYKMSQIRLPSL